MTPTPDASSSKWGDDDQSKMDILREDVRTHLGGKKEEPVTLETALAAVAPLAVPRIAVTIHAPDAEKAVEDLRTIPKSVPDRVARHPVQIELRLDTLKSDTDRAQAVFLVARLGVPVIITHRSPREGGSGQCSDEERQKLLNGIFASLSDSFSPGSLLDVEASSLAGDGDGWKSVIHAARAKNLYLMVSHHDHDGTPHDPDRLVPGEKLLQQAPGGEALLYKSATRAHDWNEELTILCALRRANLKSRRYAIMGIGRPTTRLLAPFFGPPLVYASIPGAAPAAMGQVPFNDLLDTWWRWGVTYTDEGLLGNKEQDGGPPRLALLGRPALHSLSPAMHNAALREQGLPHRYLPLEPPREPEDPEAALRTTIEWLGPLGIVGGNATAPFKQALARLADDHEGASEALGAANTFRYDDDRLVVTNTDTNGIRDPLEQAGIAINKQRVLILGAGAAAAAAGHALQDAESLTFSNRDPAKAEALAGRLPVDSPPRTVAWEQRDEAAVKATLVIQATLVGMAQTSGESQSPLDEQTLDDGHTVYELVYNPRETPLLAQAKKRGARILDGLDMLLAQGAASYRFWTGTDAPLDLMRKAVTDAQEIALPQSVQDAMQGTDPDHAPTANTGGARHGR